MSMRVFIAVIDDLYSFTTGVLLGGFLRKEKSEQHSDADTPFGATNQNEDAAPVSDTATEPADVSVYTFRSPADILESPREYSATGEKNTLMYIGGNDTPVYQHPTREFDGVIARLPYGAMVMALEQRNRWINIVYNSVSGWVLRDELMDRGAHVYPHFVVGEQNTADDPNTIRTRAMIDNMFAGGDAGFDLQPPEYVTYRLMRKGLSIDWPDTRPRTPGSWHTILRGRPGIHIDISPKTGSVMEYMQSEDAGHLAYVEAVFPDEAINISEVNYPDRGIYNERSLVREEWRELKPLFIQVT